MSMLKLDSGVNKKHSEFATGFNIVSGKEIVDKIRSTCQMIAISRPKRMCDVQTIENVPSNR